MIYGFCHMVGGRMRHTFSWRVKKMGKLAHLGFGEWGAKYFSIDCSSPSSVTRNVATGLVPADIAVRTSWMLSTVTIYAGETVTLTVQNHDAARHLIHGYIADDWKEPLDLVVVEDR